MNEGGSNEIVRLAQAAFIVFGWLFLGVGFVVFGYYVLPIMAVIGITLMVVRWLQAGFKD